MKDILICIFGAEKKVLDTVPLNLINFNAYKPICFQACA